MDRDIFICRTTNGKCSILITVCICTIEGHMCNTRRLLLMNLYFGSPSHWWGRLAVKATNESPSGLIAASPGPLTYHPHWGRPSPKIRRSLALGKIDVSHCKPAAWILLRAEWSGNPSSIWVWVATVNWHPKHEANQLLQQAIHYLHPGHTSTAQASSHPNQGEGNHCQSELCVGELVAQACTSPLQRV